MTEVPSLTDALAGLTGGARCWFWLVSEPPAEAPPLRLLPLPSSPADLLAAVRDVAVSPWAERIVGTAEVTSDGVLRMVGPARSGAALAALARWTRGASGVDRLADAELVRVDGDGVVEAVVRLASDAWAHLDGDIVPDTRPATAETLAGLDGPAWLFATDADGGFAAVQPVTADPEGAGFAEQLTAYARRFVGGRHVVGSIVPVGEVWAVRPLDGAEHAAEVLATVAAHPGLEALGEAHLPDATAPGPDLSATRAALEALAPGDAAYFVWVDGPAFLVSTDRKALAAQVKAGGWTMHARGRLARHPDGWVEVQVREAAPDLLRHLHGFVAANRGPGVDRFLGARMTVRDADGNVVSRHKIDKAWSKLEAP